MSLATGDVMFASWKTNVAGNENLDTAHVSNDIFNGNLDFPLRLPEFPYTASTLFEARLDLLTYGLTWVRHKTLYNTHSSIQNSNSMFRSFHRNCSLVFVCG